MIPEKDTNIVYFSKLLKDDYEYAPACNRIIEILQKHEIKYGFLESTSDIWARDYMPIQKGVNDFIQFRYEPSYLQDDLDIQSDPKVILKANGLKATFSDINLDGGNVIKSKEKVIITTRIFEENFGRDKLSQITSKDKNKLIDQLENLFEARVFLIPDITGDMTGHADGHVRFINENKILVNNLENEFKYWRTGFEKMIKQSGLDYIEIPWYEIDDEENPLSAIGTYVNYLEIGNLIVFPVFETKGNEDADALDVISNAFPDRIIETININEIANEGGLLNCISWTIKK